MGSFNLWGQKYNNTYVQYPFWGKAIFAILIYVFTFPSFEPDLVPGLDASYVWGLNWLFVNNYSVLTHLIYPIGPLALLKLPALEGYNFIIFLIVYTILKFGFIVSCFKLAESYSRNFYCAGALTMVASYFAGVDLMIIFLCIILCFWSVKNNNVFLFVSATSIAFIGLFIKTSIGVEALSVIFVSWLINFYKNRNFRNMLIWALSVVACAIVVGMAVLHDFGTLVDYYWGTIHLVFGYGGALSLHPDNSWIALIIFILIIAIFPLFSGDKASVAIFSMSIIPLFASWKHAFVREDMPHYQAIVTYIIVFWCIVLMVKSMRRGYTVACALLSIVLLHYNMKEIPGYSARKIEYCGINNFVGTIFEYDKFMEQNNRLTNNALWCEKLPDEVLSKIGNSTIDFYPWEHTYAKVNNLNWQPRKTIEIGASTSKWLSDLASENFAGDNSVEYVLWHFGKDGFTIDWRYPLNDEPNVVYNILNNYNADYYGDNYIIWKRRSTARGILQDVGDLVTANINDWISVPDCGENIQRIKVESEVNFAGYMKSTFFKDEMYYVDYMTNSGEIFTYRYVPSTAVDGLWVNPLVTNFVHGDVADRVEKVRFRVSNDACVKNNISLRFETWNIPLADMFHVVSDSSKLLYMNAFENKESNITDEYAYSGLYSNIVESQNFSITYEVPMESIWALVADSVDVELKASCRFLNTGSSCLVVSIDGNEKQFYKSKNFGNTGLIYWWSSELRCRIRRDDYPTGILKVYVWNNGNYPTYIDDLKVSVF